MQSTRSGGSSGLEVQRVDLTYQHRLNFYDEPPINDITLEDFEIFALDRLRVLGEIESAFVRNRPYEEAQKSTESMCKKYLPLHANTAKTIDRDAERRKDHVGHFVLRLAFCRSEDLRRRFIKAEVSLFRFRYESDDRNERSAFLSSKDFGWTEADLSDADRNRDIRAATPGMKDVTDGDFTKEKFYQVHWTRVPDLVEKRKVYLSQGFAYVHSSQQSSIVYQEFEKSLTKALEQTARALPRLDEDTRILPILDHLSQGFVAGISSEYNGDGDGEGGLKADMVDDIARKHYPMCMRNLHDNLRRHRHLKHYGRLQYGLFLKALGLSVEEALAFWRKSFSNITDEKFNKEYRYNIRHSYGLEGKRVNYPARDCQRILTSDQPGPTDSHGCPFRHFSADNLSPALLATYSSQGLSSNDMPEILRLVKDRHYHLACTRVFEVTHGLKPGTGVSGESISHPNRYTARSRELEQEKKDAMSID